MTKQPEVSTRFARYAHVSRSLGIVSALCLLGACGGDGPRRETKSEAVAAVTPPALVEQRQGVASEDAIVVAQALPQRDRKRWSSPDQKLPMVKGELQGVPADAILLELSLTELRVAGVRVLALEQGRLPQPPALGEPDPVTTKILEAVLAEGEALPKSADFTLAIAADTRVPSSTVVRIAELTMERKGLVARSALVEAGFIGISSPSRATPGDAALRIDAEGFHLTGPSGKTEHIPAPYDVEALATKVIALADAQTDSLPLFVKAEPETPAGVFVSVLAQLEQPGCDEDDTCRDIRVRLQYTARGEAESSARRDVLLAQLAPGGGHFLASPSGAFSPDLTEEDLTKIAAESELLEPFGKGAAPLPATGRKKVPRVRQAKATVKGAIDKDIIRRTVRTHISEVRSCYTKALSKDPALEGRVVVDFTIGSKGKVTASSVTSTTLTDEGVGTCIAGAAKLWKFPKPKGGGAVLVTYPFTLAPG